MISTNDAGALRCPGCGGCFLHHFAVEVFERSEDALDDETLKVRVGDGRLEVERSNQGNSSRRRHGVRLELQCETCDVKSALTIAQHKGETLVRIGTDTQ